MILTIGENKAQIFQASVMFESGIGGVQEPNNSSRNQGLTKFAIEQTFQLKKVFLCKSRDTSLNLISVYLPYPQMSDHGDSDWQCQTLRGLVL